MANRNETTWYYALDEAMLVAHRENRDDYAESTARILLEYAELPLLIRARACMILGCSNEPDSMDMAREAVRIAELGFSLCDDPGDFEKQLVEDCEALLAEVEALAAAEEDGEGDGDGAKESESASDAAELVPESENVADTAPLPAAEQKKGSRRLITDPTKMMGPATSPPPRDRKPRQTAIEEASVEDEHMADAANTTREEGTEDDDDEMEL